MGWDTSGPPYKKEDPAPGIPAPKADLREIGVLLWQHDLWWTIVNAALRGEPNKVDLSYHPALNRPAVSRYAATTPRLPVPPTRTGLPRSAGLSSCSTEA